MQGIKWQDDTSYFIYNKHVEDLNFITILNRDNGLIVSSSFGDQIKIMVNQVNVPDTVKWQTKWAENLVRSEINSVIPKYIIFISRNDSLVTMLNLINPLTNDYFRISPDGNGKWDLNFLPKLKGILEAPNKEIDVPIRFQYIPA